MTRKMRIPLLLAMAAIISTAASAEAAENELAQQGYALLKKYCYRCHGIDFKVPGMNVLDLDTLTAVRKDADPYLIVGKPDASYLWQRVGVDGDMPPEDAPDRPSDAEKELLKRWILEGAPFPGREARPFQSERQVVAAIHAHLSKAKVSDRPFLRYFTLTNLFNNHKNVTDDEMRLVPGGAVEADQQPELAADDRRAAGRRCASRPSSPSTCATSAGTRTTCGQEVLKVYPYGLKHDQLASDANFASLAEDVYACPAADLPYIRADWFIATASRPPLYHTLLDLPENAKDLEKKLNVDVEADFLRNKLARAGFATSGVSSQNRLVDRHPAIARRLLEELRLQAQRGNRQPVPPPARPDVHRQPVHRPGLRARRRRDHLQPAQRPAGLLPDRRQGQADRRRADRGRQRRPEDLRHAGDRQRVSRAWPATSTA